MLGAPGNAATGSPTPACGSGSRFRIRTWRRSSGCGGDPTLSRIEERWTSRRVRAIEPLVRESLARLLPDGLRPAAPAIRGYRTRSNDVEIDLVGADRQPVARRSLFLGSGERPESSAFDGHDLAALRKHRAAITDEPVPLVAVSRNGISCSSGLQTAYGPGKLLSARHRA